MRDPGIQAIEVEGVIFQVQDLVLVLVFVWHWHRHGNRAVGEWSSMHDSGAGFQRDFSGTGKVPRVRQVGYVVRRAHKPATLERILDMEDPVATLVFCRTRMEVESLVETFNAPNPP